MKTLVACLQAFQKLRRDFGKRNGAFDSPLPQPNVGVRADAGTFQFMLAATILLWLQPCAYALAEVSTQAGYALSHLESLVMLADAPPDVIAGLKQVVTLIMQFAFVMGVILVVKGAWDTRRGDDGKGYLLAGATMSGAVAIMYFLFKAFGKEDIARQF